MRFALADPTLIKYIDVTCQGDADKDVNEIITEAEQLEKELYIIFVSFRWNDHIYRDRNGFAN